MKHYINEIERKKHVSDTDTPSIKQMVMAGVGLLVGAFCFGVLLTLCQGVPA
jgi:hypothetical protein